MADSSREAGQQSCARNCPQPCPQGCSETGRIAWGQSSPDLETAAGEARRRRGPFAASWAMPRAEWPRIRFIAGCHPDVRIRVAFIGIFANLWQKSSRDLFACNGTGAFASTNNRQAFEPVRGACLTGPKYPGLPCFGVQLCIPRRRSRHSSWPPTPHLPRPWRTGFGPCRGSGSGIPVHRHQGRREPGHPGRPRSRSRVAGGYFCSSTPSTAFLAKSMACSRPRRNSWSLDPIDGTRAFISGNPLWGTLLALLYRGKPVLGDRCADAGRALDRYAGACRI